MKAIVLIALALAPAEVLAADAASASPPATATGQLAPVEVTATRTEVPAAQELPLTIVIGREQIERAQAGDVAEVLRRYAGLEVARSGGPGQPASLFVRGGNSDYVLVLIDGVRVNNDSDGAAALANISTAMIERIEVVQGPRSTLYGADAVSGVVNVITRQPGPAQLDADAGGGSFGTVRGGAALRGAGQVDGHDWGLAFGAEQQRSAGIPTFAGASQDSSYRNRTLNGRAQLALGGVRLEARAWDAEGNTQYLNPVYDPATFLFTGAFTPAGEDFRDRILALTASTRPTANWQSELTFSQGEDRLAQNQSADYTRTVRPEADWHNVLTLDPHQRLSFGALASRERVDALSFGTTVVQHKDNDYVYLQDELRYGAHSAVAALNYVHDGAFGERFDWNAEYGYELPSATRLILCAGSAYHAPTANDLYGFGGNPNLQPEKALTYEAAVRQAFGPRQSAELRLFRSDVRDLIEFLPDPSSPFFFTGRNVAHSRSDGAQAYWRYADQAWQASAGAIWQNARDRDAGTQLLRRARIGGDAMLDRRWGRYDFGAEFHSSGRRRDVGAIDGLPTTDGGYALVSLTTGVRLTRELRLDLRGDNVLNHRYQTAAGYNQAGSAVYATLRYAMPL